MVGTIAIGCHVDKFPMGGYSSGMKCWRYGFLVLLWGLTAVFISGCDASALPPVAADDLVQQTAVRMNELPGFRFDISREGAPAYLDPDNVLSLRRAAGAYAAPDKAIATVRVIGPGIITDVDVVSIGDIQWQTNVATGEWEELPPNWGFNPAILFDDTVGLPTILQQDLTNLQMQEPDNLQDRGGADELLYQVTGTAVGDNLYTLSGGLIGPEPVDVSLWIRPETWELVRVQLTEPGPTPEETTIWQVDFANYGEVLEIAPPLP